MKKFLAVLLVLSQLWGCAVGLKTYSGSARLFQDGQTLWQISIVSGDEQLFTGLLALGYGEDALRAVLLDSTGIKLLEEKVSASGEIEIVSELPPVRDKGLTPFLGKALHRLVFTQERTGSSPCRRDGLLEYCFGIESSGHLVKLKRLGPFRLWSVDYFINNYDLEPDVSRARIDAVWPAPSLVLERNDGDEK